MTTLRPPCPACSEAAKNFIADESGLPASIERLDSRPNTRFVAGVDPRALRWCRACDRVFELWHDQREGLVEIAELPSELIELLQGRGGVAQAAVLLDDVRFVPDWVRRWLAVGAYEPQEAIDAFVAAALAGGVKPGRVTQLVSAWCATLQRAKADGRAVDARLADFEAASRRPDVFREARDAYAQKRVDEMIRAVAATLPGREGARRDAEAEIREAPLDRLVRLDAPPRPDEETSVQRALLDVKQNLVPHSTLAPEADVRKLVAAVRVTSTWAANAEPFSFASLVARDVRECLNVLRINFRVPPALAADVADAVDPGARALLDPQRVCTAPDAPKPSSCGACRNVHDGAPSLPKSLQLLTPSCRIDVPPVFVTGSWVVTLDEDRLALCASCGAIFQLCGTPSRPAPQVTRLPASARTLLNSRSTAKEIQRLLDGPDYHASRLRGLRDLVWRMIDGGFGYYAQQDLADAFVAVAVEPGRCADVAVDAFEFLARLVETATRHIVDAGWPRDRAVDLGGATALAPLLTSGAFGHTPTETHAEVRRRALATLARSALTSSGAPTAGVRSIPAPLLDAMRSATPTN